MITLLLNFSVHKSEALHEIANENTTFFYFYLKFIPIYIKTTTSKRAGG